jgi:hypothetical protein
METSVERCVCLLAWVLHMCAPEKSTHRMWRWSEKVAGKHENAV